MKLFVGKLSFITTEPSLAVFFKKFAPNSCKIVTDQHTGSSRGFAFVEIDDARQGALAITELHGMSLDGRKIVVCEAPSSDPIPGGRRGASGGALGRSSKGRDMGFGYRH
jgi:RNA recognition motif-containing protein